MVPTHTLQAWYRITFLLVFIILPTIALSWQTQPTKDYDRYVSQQSLAAAAPAPALAPPHHELNTNPPAGSIDSDERESLKQAMTQIELVGRFGLGAPKYLLVEGTTLYYASTSGLTLFEVSNPSAPQRTGFIPLPGEITDVEVKGQYAYVTVGSQGLIIIDVSDPKNPRSIMTYRLPRH